MSDLTIIAEAGVNHNGSLKNALRLVDIAAKAKADFVKFQTFVPESLVQKNFKSAKYQKKNSKFLYQYEMLKKYQLTIKDHIKIMKRCKKKKIKFLSSPFDLESIKILKKLKLSTIKVPSGEINNIPYLEEIGRLKKKVILSSGMANKYEIDIAINTLKKKGTSIKNISLLHCNTEYPADFLKINLNSIRYLKDRYKIKVGYSDHTIGFEAALLSLGMGAEIIEKHFTINKNLKGPDHKASLEADELCKFVDVLRRSKKSLGGYFKKPYKKELLNAKFIRKNIVASKKIRKGETFSKKNLTTKRSKPGISASRWNEVLFKKSKYNFKKDQNIKI